MNWQNKEPQRNIYAVIGFARSGSSLITRGLQALGIDLGNKIVKFEKDNSWNTKGFFEDEEIIYQILVKVFKKLDYGKRGILLMDKNLQTGHILDEIRNDAVRILQHRFSSTEHFCFKNPNTSKLLPFWESVFKKLNAHENYIITLRNPLSSAKSFSERTQLDLEVCLLLWLMHTIPAIEDTFGKKRIVVSYELMIQDPKRQLERIKNILSIPPLADAQQIELFTQEFLDEKLNRHPLHDEDLETHPSMSVAPLCRDVYHLLMKLAKDELSFECAEFHSSWRNIMNELDKVYPLYCLLDTTLRRNKQLRRALKVINKSIVWKLLYPLRLIDDKLREIRMKDRLRRRVITAYE